MFISSVYLTFLLPKGTVTGLTGCRVTSTTFSDNSRSYNILFRVNEAEEEKNRPLSTMTIEDVIRREKNKLKTPSERWKKMKNCKISHVKAKRLSPLCFIGR